MGVAMRYVGTTSGFITTPKGKSLKVFWKILGAQTELGNVIIVDKLNRWRL
jgi:hypothetical protein